MIAELEWDDKLLSLSIVLTYTTTEKYGIQINSTCVDFHPYIYILEFNFA